MGVNGAKVKGRAKQPLDEIPDELLSVPGVLQDFVNYFRYRMLTQIVEFLRKWNTVAVLVDRQRVLTDREVRLRHLFSFVQSSTLNRNV